MVGEYTMTMDKVLLAIFLLYIVMTALYAYDKFWMHGSVQETVFTLILCLGLPGVGSAILWMMDYYSEKRTEKDYSEIFEGNSFFRDELSLLRPLDKEKELNNVPMEEALKINDYELRRKMVMDTLKEDNTLDYLNVLKEALENEDSETSHYASSIIMLLQEKTQKQILAKEKALEEDPENQELGRELEEELFVLLDSRLLAEENLRRYYLEYDKVSDHLLKEEMPEEKLFRHRISICFQKGDFTGVQEIIRQYENLYPKSEDAVLCRLQFCIYTKDSAGLAAFLGGLGDRPVTLTQKTLEYVRFFRTQGKKGDGAKV